MPYNEIWQPPFAKTVTKYPFVSFKKHGKHDDYTMIMSQIMTTMPKTWPHCRHHGMIMTMFRHDHGMIMARSRHGSHVFPNRDCFCLSFAREPLQSSCKNFHLFKQGFCEFNENFQSIFFRTFIVFNLACAGKLQICAALPKKFFD